MMTEATGSQNETNSGGDAIGETAAGRDVEPAETGTSLAPSAETSSGVDPFIAAAETPNGAAATPRPIFAKALDYAAPAAMIVGLIGFAWTVSDHVVSRHTAPATPAKLADATATPLVQTPAASATPKADEIGDLRKTNQRMAAELRSLRANLEALRTTVVRERTAAVAPEGASADVKALSASLDSLKSSVAGAKSEQSAAIAQLSARVEKLQREERAPLPVADRKPDRHELDTSATASIPSPSPVKVPTPPTKPTVLASAEPDDAQAKPQVVSGWVVRDVYQGVALIEGRRGQMEVVPGVSIPGGGTVKSIERHNGTWTVTTTKGQLAVATPPHEMHRGSPHDYYGPRRWDF